MAAHGPPGPASTTRYPDLAVPFGSRDSKRLLRLGRASEAFYREKRREFLMIYRKLEPPREGEFYRSLPREAVYNYGRPFVRLVLENYYQDRIPLSDVAKFLSIRAKQLGRVEELMGG